jgi:DNA-binding GntR family transcriptional regulator
MDPSVKISVDGARLPLSRVIRDALVQQIVSGELAAGDRLVETRLAAEFGTSQAPVREALRELEGLGLVAVVPRRGSFVRPFVHQTLRESYVVRAALEETATRLALLAGTLPVEALEADVAEMREAAGHGDNVALGRASVSFHRHVVTSAGNELLLHSWEALQIEARTAVTLLAVDPDPMFIAEDHHHLLHAMRGGDLEAACREARDHQWNFADLPHDAHGRAR